jgi:hypothetical protein
MFILASMNPYLLHALKLDLKARDKQNLVIPLCADISAKTQDIHYGNFDHVMALM